MVFSILGVLFMLVIGTFWIWVPILIIVLVNRSNKKKAAEVYQAQQQWAAQQQQWGAQQPRVSRDSGREFEDFERNELNEKLYAELRKDEPDIGRMKEILKEIEGLKVEVKAEMPKETHDDAPAVSSAMSNNFAQANAQTNYVPEVKPQNEHAGLNAILYIGSLLVVAGVGALIASMLPDGMKMMIMLLMVVIFYAGGLLVRKDERLLVAGKAFVGTALAIIPFLGFAFEGFLQVPGEIAWLWTSILGLIAYVVATIALHSKVIAFLSVAFLISLALSMCSTLALPMMYYFIFVMLIGVVASVVRIFAQKKVPELFSEVVDVTGKWLTLLTLVASLFLVGTAEMQMYVWLFWIATAQMGLQWWNNKTLGNELLFRGMAHIAVLVWLNYIFDGDLVIFGIAFGMVAVLQATVSMVLGAMGGKIEREGVEWAVTILMCFAAMASCLLVWGGGESKLASVVCLVAMAFVGLASGICSVIYRKTGWLYGVLIAMAGLPLIIGSWVLVDEARWGEEVYFSVYFVLMAVVVAIRGLIGKKGGKYDALGLSGMVGFGLMAMAFSLGLSASYQVAGLMIWAIGFGAYGWIIKNMMIAEMGVYVLGIGIWRAIGAVPSLEGWMVGMLGLYVMSLAFGLSSWWKEREKAGEQRVRMGFVLSLVIFASMATWYSGDTMWQILSMVIATGVWLGYGWMIKKRGIMEVGAYFAGVTLCRMVGEVISSGRGDGWAHTIAYAHIMALVFFGMSMWLERGKSKVRLGLGMGILTAVMGIRALSASTAVEMMTYPLWFLVEQVVFVVAGGLSRKKWIWVWGTCGICVAVLWFVRDMAFIWLMLLGFGLIGLVVWRLLKGSKKG